MAIQTIGILTRLAKRLVTIQPLPLLTHAFIVIQLKIIIYTASASSDVVGAQTAILRTLQSINRIIYV